MTAKRVYIVCWRDYITGDAVFKEVFFTREAAEKWINCSKYVHEYEIECYEEAEDGKSREVY